MAPKRKPITTGKGTNTAKLVTPDRSPRPISAKPSKAGLERSAKKTTSSGITKRPDGRAQSEGRSGRQSISRATVTSASNGKPTGGSARVTTGKGQAPKPAAKPQMVNSNSATMRQIQAKADAARARAQGKPGITGPVKLPNSVRAGRNLIREGANRMRNLADSGQIRAAAQRGQQAVEAVRRNRARLAAGVGQGAVERAAFKSGVKTGGRLLLPVAIASQIENVASGFKELANHPFIKGRPKPVTPKPATPKGPTPAQRKDFDAQERKARQSLTARKKAAGSKEATPNTAKSFDDAFKDARRAKVGSFTWRGKKYTTEMK
jgi:hypothetical protein